VVAKSGRGDSKQSLVVTMLQRKQGATIAAIMTATGWQRHSVRAFLTAVVRKKLGLTLLSEKPAEERIYRTSWRRMSCQSGKVSQDARPPHCHGSPWQ
jgi:Protein of unknown function (DUF3489)